MGNPSVVLVFIFGPFSFFLPLLYFSSLKNFKNLFCKKLSTLDFILNRILILILRILNSILSFQFSLSFIFDFPPILNAWENLRKFIAALWSFDSWSLSLDTNATSHQHVRSQKRYTQSICSFYQQIHPKNQTLRLFSKVGMTREFRWFFPLSDGRQEGIHFDKITSRIGKLAYGLNPDHVDTVGSQHNTKLWGSSNSPFFKDTDSCIGSKWLIGKISEVRTKKVKLNG